MIKAVFFDLDGTLFDRDATVASVLAWQVQEFSSVIGIERAAEFCARVTTLDEHGHREKREVYQVVGAEFGLDIPVVRQLIATFWLEYPNHCWPAAGVVDTLAELRNPNAALRYWMAFALMQDPPADAATRTLLEAVADGRAPWDETRLGSLLDANAEALRTMQRATALPDCDWGLEYALGPETPIAHLARARVLARLNVLAGMRAMARGNASEATSTWLAGLRFARHVPYGGSVLAALTGRVMLGSTIVAIARAVEEGGLDAVQRQRVRDVVRTLPETGFDWGAAYQTERVALDSWVAQLARDPAPERAYQRAVGAVLPSGVSLPTGASVTAFGAFMNRAAAAVRLSPATASKELEDLQRAVQTLHPFYRPLIPSLSRINDARAQLKGERDRLVAAVAR